MGRKSFYGHAEPRGVLPHQASARVKINVEMMVGATGIEPVTLRV